MQFWLLSVIYRKRIFRLFKHIFFFLTKLHFSKLWHAYDLKIKYRIMLKKIKINNLNTLFLITKNCCKYILNYIMSIYWGSRESNYSLQLHTCKCPFTGQYKRTENRVWVITAVSKFLISLKELKKKITFEQKLLLKMVL